MQGMVTIAVNVDEEIDMVDAKGSIITEVNLKDEMKKKRS